MLLKNIFAEKFGEKNWRFLLNLFLKNVIRTLVFEKSAHFFAENGKNGRKL
jgi:hypothetical protein